jgi:integrase/recombinase XerD
MNDTSPKISPLRQRMIEDMRMRKLAPKTQSSYIRARQRRAKLSYRRPVRWREFDP